MKFFKQVCLGGSSLKKLKKLEKLHLFMIPWDLANFRGEIQTTSTSNFCSFYGVNGPILDYFIKRVYCAKMCIFWDIAHFYHFFGLKFLRWNSHHFQVEFLCFLWDEWTILRLFYWGMYYVKVCIFWIYCSYIFLYRT